MGNVFSTAKNIKKIDAISLQSLILDKNNIIINTLNESEQYCLIQNTISANEEVNIINNYIKHDKNVNIIIYGKNSHDDKIIEKYIQLNKLGFINLHLYMGGLFEWLLLQQIFGDNEFPTTSKCYNYLNFK